MSEKKQKFKSDPFANREAEKYENPIPSREFILDELEKKGHPLALPHFLEIFSIDNEQDEEAIRRRLRAMERDGQLIRNRKGAYGNVKKMDLIRGRVIGHADGFGFLVPDDGSADLFLTAKRMKGIMHGDRIVARISGEDRRGRREGAMVEVLEHANHQIVGRFHQEYGAAFVEPSNKRIAQSVLVPPPFRGGAVDGQMVVVDVIEQPTFRSQPIGKIVEVLGDHMAPGMEIDIAARMYELPVKWPAAVEAVAKELPSEVPESAKLNREDIRDLQLVTIDGEDSRDFDDAVFCEKQGRYWRLLVAIADVSHYVEPESALDEEAQNRGNSVYFPGSVVPMLPEGLSNGLCSLNPHVDRLCLVCEMTLTQTGVLKSSRFFNAVMNSSARLTYNEVAAMVIDRDETVRQQYEEILPAVDRLYELYEIFKTKRKKRGVIEFETTETRIVFGENKKIDRILPVERNEAHKIIEEFMVAANVATAKYLEENEMPTLYRVHNGPTEQKLVDLRTFLAEGGFKLGGGSTPETKHYATLLESLKGRPDFPMYQTVLLRSLSQAVYCPDNAGHFGLAFDAYAHFTSPIRRYPDLLVHRGIKHLIEKKNAKSFIYSHSNMEKFGDNCSMTERRADDATRDAMDWLKTEFMLEKVGQEFTGKVTGVTGFGLFVLLDEAYVEGLVHITALDNDYYHFDNAKHRLVGERNNKIYQLADEIKIRVARVDLDEKKIDFELASSEPGSGNMPKKGDFKSKKKPGGKKSAKDKKPAAKTGAKPKKKTSNAEVKKKPRSKAKKTNK